MFLSCRAKKQRKKNRMNKKQITINDNSGKETDLFTSLRNSLEARATMTEIRSKDFQLLVIHDNWLTNRATVPCAMHRAIVSAVKEREANCGHN
jgi:hypothetical protein